MCLSTCSLNSTYLLWYKNWTKQKNKVFKKSFEGISTVTYETVTLF